MDTAIGLIVGIGLSAACGFRVFVPFLGLSLAAMNGYITLANGFQWIGTWPAFIAFLSATGIEVAAYYIPWIDNLLDTIASPAAVIAGIIATASIALDIPPFLKWSLAIVAGGGAAGIIQGGTVITRALSSTTLPVPANLAVATIELISSIATTVVAIFMPAVAIVVVLLIVSWSTMRIFRNRESGR